MFPLLLAIGFGIGVYLLIVGGAVAIAGAFLDQQQQSKM